MSNLGFSVNALLPHARGGGRLRMGLQALAESEWLQPAPDLALRKTAFDADATAVQIMREVDAPGEELASMLGANGGLEGAARSAWEDMCLLTRRPGENLYRLAGAAVAFPSDWRPAEKLGLPLVALHQPIHGYAEQLASGVDHFMSQLQPGKIFGRTNWFVAPTGALHWIGEPPERAFAHVSACNAGETLFVRCERQTLRKLPETQAILFTIGIYVAPLGTLSIENVSRLADAIATMPPPEAERRGTAYYAPALQAYALRIRPVEEAA
jgi:dimethylamine monooxygenase subunit A